jgi:hypothetical protein
MKCGGRREAKDLIVVVFMGQQILISSPPLQEQERKR